MNSFREVGTKTWKYPLWSASLGLALLCLCLTALVTSRGERRQFFIAAFATGGIVLGLVDVLWTRLDLTSSEVRMRRPWPWGKTQSIPLEQVTEVMPSWIGARDGTRIEIPDYFGQWKQIDGEIRRACHARGVEF
jgi:hypothetical protein